MTQTMFEIFRIPKFYVGISAVMSLYASGLTTGLVFESGDGATSTVPIYEGCVIPSPAVTCMNLGGRDVTEYLEEGMQERGYWFKTSSEKDIVKNIKEQFTYVAFNYEEELKKEEETPNEIQTTYQMPDGKEITIGAERFKCTEELFNPNPFRAIKHEGIHKSVVNSIMKCMEDIHKELFTNILMSGGSTMFPGMMERMQKEIQVLAPTNIVVKIMNPPQRKYSSWIGASMFSSLSAFQEMWITEEEYDEAGPSIVHRKCSP